MIITTEKKKIDIRRIFTDIIKYFIGTFVITVIFCVCTQNGWIFPSGMGIEKIGYSQFWHIAQSFSYLIPLIICIRGWYGCYAITSSTVVSSPPMGKAVIKKLRGEL